MKQHAAELRARADLDHDGRVDAEEMAKAREALQQKFRGHEAGPNGERSQADGAPRAPVKKAPDHVIPITPRDIYESHGAGPKGGGAQRGSHGAKHRSGGGHRRSGGHGGKKRSAGGF